MRYKPTFRGQEGKSVQPLTSQQPFRPPAYLEKCPFLERGTYNPELNRGAGNEVQGDAPAPAC
jgi:hypothetical protein